MPFTTAACPALIIFPSCYLLKILTQRWSFKAVNVYAEGVDGFGSNAEHWQALERFWAAYFSPMGTNLERYSALRDLPVSDLTRPGSVSLPGLPEEPVFERIVKEDVTVSYALDQARVDQVVHERRCGRNIARTVKVG